MALSIAASVKAPLNGRFGLWEPLLQSNHWALPDGRRVKPGVMVYQLEPPLGINPEFEGDLPVLYISLTQDGLAYKMMESPSSRTAVKFGTAPAAWSDDVEENAVLYFEAADAVLQIVEDDDLEVFQNPEFMGGRANHVYKTKVSKVPASSAFKKDEPVKTEKPKVDWRLSNDPVEIEAGFKAEFSGKKPKRDDLLDLIDKASALRNNRLVNLAKSHKLESRGSAAKRLVRGLLSESLWKSEFGDDYQVPGWALTDGVTDTSWHNDACPSFAVDGIEPESDDYTVLWVEHPNPEMREFPTERFVITRGAAGSHDTKVVWRGDDEKEAVEAWNNEVSRNRK